MGKVVKFTGSKLLGGELRRLRAGRTLDDVVAYSRRRLGGLGLKALSKATLSEIENGRTLPTLETALGLAVVYQVPPAQLFYLLLEESARGQFDAPDTDDELRDAFSDAILGNRPVQALALAGHGYRRAASGWPALRWRLNRSNALERLGLRWDAITEHNACIDDASLPRELRYLMHHDLSRMHTAAYQLTLAEMHGSRALALMPPSIEPTRRSEILQGYVGLLRARALVNRGLTPDEIETIERMLDEAAALHPGTEGRWHLAHRILRGTLLELRGDVREACRLYTRVAAQAKAAGIPTRQAEALLSLALTDKQMDRPTRHRHMVTAAELFLEAQKYEQAFVTLVELIGLATTPGQRAAYFRRCQRIYPLVQFAHPSVRIFEQMNNRARALPGQH